jgi:hypothetical protein
MRRTIAKVRYLDLEAQVSAGEDESLEEDETGTLPIHYICYWLLICLKTPSSLPMVMMCRPNDPVTFPVAPVSTQFLLLQDTRKP